MCVCVYVCICACVYMCMCVCVYMCMCVYVYVRVVRGATTVFPDKLSPLAFCKVGVKVQDLVMDSHAIFHPEKLGSPAAMPSLAFGKYHAA